MGERQYRLIGEGQSGLIGEGGWRSVGLVYIFLIQNNCPALN